MFPTRSTFHPAVLLVLAALLFGGVAAWRGSGMKSSGIGARAGTGARSAKQERAPAGSAQRYPQLLARLEAAAADHSGAELEGQGLSALHRLTESLASADFAALLGLGSASEELRLKLLLAWAELDPQAAAEGLGLWAGGPPAEAFGLLAEAWARRDLEGAGAWVRGLPSGAEQETALLALGGEAAPREPRLAIELVRTMKFPEATEILVKAAGAWTATEPEAAAEWARSLEDPARREAVLAGIATAWADRDPYAAAKLVLDSIGEGSIEENSIVGIVQRLAFQDLTGARQWVAQFPEGRTRERAEAEVQRIAGRLGR